MKLKKKKKICGTQVPFKELEFMELEFHLSIFKELEFYIRNLSSMNSSSTNFFILFYFYFKVSFRNNSIVQKSSFKIGAYP